MSLQDRHEQYYIHRCQKHVYLMFPWICIKSVCRLHHPTQTLPGWLLVLMLPQNATSPPVPTHSTLPPGVAEFLTSLFQKGTLPLPSAGQTPVLPASSMPPLGIPPPAEGRSFTRPGRGEGGVCQGHSSPRRSHGS